MKRIIVWTFAFVASFVLVAPVFAQTLEPVNVVLYGRIDNGRGLGLSSQTDPYPYVNLYRLVNGSWWWVNQTDCWRDRPQACANQNGDFTFTHDWDGKALPPGRYKYEGSAVNSFLSREEFNAPTGVVAVSIRRRPLIQDWSTTRVNSDGRRQARVILDLIREGVEELDVVLRYFLAGPTATEAWDEGEPFKVEPRMVRDYRTRLDETFSIEAIPSGHGYCVIVTVRERPTNKFLARLYGCDLKPY